MLYTKILYGYILKRYKLNIKTVIVKSENNKIFKI